jgi:hypothetical protein
MSKTEIFLLVMGVIFACNIIFALLLILAGRSDDRI